jgi:hypothetical protein
MAGTLKASIFLNFQNKFEQRCISLFENAYQTSITNNAIELDFDENDITAILHKYIDENPKKRKWSIVTNVENFIYDETIIPIKGFAAKFSRIDMRFAKIDWLNNEYTYFVEAKNLKSNNSALKRRYIDTGIDNFLRGGKYFECAGLLVGYILEGTIRECIDNGVNKLLIKDGRNAEIIQTNPSNNYQSDHPNRILKHLFFNFVN